MSNVTVLGATGGLGAAITRELAGREHQVRAVSRQGTTPASPNVLPAAADLTDREQARLACAGADVIVMAAQVPYRQWETVLPGMIDNVLEAAEAAGARLVMVDNLYAYGSPGTSITEATPEQPGTRKGELRRRLGQHLLAAHHDGRVRVTIGRVSDYYGPGGTNAVVYQLGIARALAGKAPQAFIDADQPHTFAYLPDAARGFAVLVEQPNADGRVWILPAAPALTQRELLEMVAVEAGLTPKVGRVSKPMLTLAGLLRPDLRELSELVGQWDRPYITDASAFKAAFGAAGVTPHGQAVAETVGAFKPAQRQ